MRVVEIGCGPGAAAHAVAELVGPGGHVLANDRSPRAIEQVLRTASELIAEGRASAREDAADDLELLPGEAPYDLTFVVRVGAMDGPFAEAGVQALRRLMGVPLPAGSCLDGGDPLRLVHLPLVMVHENEAPFCGAPRVLQDAIQWHVNSAPQARVTPACRHERARGCLRCCTTGRSKSGSTAVRKNVAAADTLSCHWSPLAQRSS